MGDALATPQNVLLRVAFDGTDFHGWQLQPRVRTVQGVVHAAVEQMVSHPVTLWATSRTDVGVHARALPVNFESTRHIPPQGFLRGLNALLPRDVGVRQVDVVDPSFRARRDALAKTYTYRFLLGDGRDALVARTAWWMRRPALDVAAMRRAAEHLLGDHDFSAFRSARCDAKTTRRRMYRVEIGDVDDLGVITMVIVGNAFMRNMVRIIAGTLAEVGLGRLAPADVEELLRSGLRTEAGPTAPACGLTLTAVHFEGYPRLGKLPPNVAPAGDTSG